MNKSTARGRRPGRPEVREQIRTAARARFLASGYQAVSMRSIAADAGVDVALVSYYFGSKQGLFNAALALPVNPAERIETTLAGDDEGLAERVLRMAVGLWDDPATGAPLRAIAGAAPSDPELRRLVAEFLRRELIDPIAARIGGSMATERAAAFATQMSGFLFSRALLGVEPIASFDPDELVRRLAPALQLALYPDQI
jgi:AcrR family transcriptional regulator